MGEFTARAEGVSEEGPQAYEANVARVCKVIEETKHEEKHSKEKCTILAIDPGATSGYCISDGHSWNSNSFAIKDLHKVMGVLRDICDEFVRLKDSGKGVGKGLVVVERPPVLPHMSRISIQTFSLEVGVLVGMLKSILGNESDTEIVTVFPAQWVASLYLNSSDKKYRQKILKDPRVAALGVRLNSNKTDEADAVLLCIASRYFHMRGSTLQPFGFNPKSVR